MSEIYYKVLYAGEEYSTNTDPGLKTLLTMKASSLTITDVKGIEHTFSITPGVPIAVSQHPVKNTEPRKVVVI